MSEPGAIRRLPRPGTIVPFGGDTVPDGWLLCNGAEVSRTEYARLFAAVDTRWGAGDGSTTFNLPDGRGEVLQGADSTNSLGVEIEAGLPNATGHGAHFLNGNNSYWYNENTGGAFYHNSSETVSVVCVAYGNDTVVRSPDDCIRMNLSYYNSLFGSSTTVQQQAIATNYMIRC